MWTPALAIPRAVHVRCGSDTLLLESPTRLLGRGGHTHVASGPALLVGEEVGLEEEKQPDVEAGHRAEDEVGFLLGVPFAVREAIGQVRVEVGQEEDAGYAAAKDELGGRERGVSEVYERRDVQKRK